MPAGSMEEDLFYDLFGEDGLMTPESTGSTDSGHGSPLESNFDDASPLHSFGWDAADDHGEFWGSILDDLPSDITDDSDSNAEKQDPLLHQDNVNVNTVSESYNQTFPTSSWNTKVLEESSTFHYNNNINFDDDWNMNGNVFNDAKQLPVSMDYTAAINNDISRAIREMPMNKQKQIQIQPTAAAAAIKQVDATEAWVTKASDTKSSFQIGQNIFSIIQNVNNKKTSPNVNVDMNSLCDILTGKVKTSAEPTNINERNPAIHRSLSDHDYAEKDTSDITTPTSGVSEGMGPGLTLTDEEKKLLDMESLKLPEGVPLTKAEEKILKKVRRKIKNKQSAMESRKRRKDYIYNLEHRVKHCTDLNNDLKKKVDTLTKENKTLVNQMKVMKEFITTSLQQTRVSTGTCLAVLLLSFALFILPFNPLHYFDGKPETVPTGSPSPSVTFRSRTLLSIEDNTDYIDQDNEFINSSYPMLYHNYFHEPHNQSVEIYFENIRDAGSEYAMRRNITMFTHQKFPLYSMVNNTSNDLYVTS